LYASWRSWISYQFPNRVGVRVRYWEFDQQVTNDANVFAYGLDAYVLDVEGTYGKSLGSNWEVLLTGGVRQVGFHEDRTATNLPSFIDSHLTGLVLGGEMSRGLFGGLRSYGITRAAAVFGDTTGEVPPGFVVIFENTYRFMWEAQLGLEWRRDTEFGELALRVGAEVHHWDSISYKSDPITRDPESVGLAGVVTGLTFRR
jgi:hypothetical protein